jgi:wyosine [tRNA(Phe)-imidazoG37] synthetase (radical SAM superfamily)
LEDQRREYVPIEEVLLQLDRKLQKYNAGDLDWLTFAGSGEPTLHSGLGKLIRLIKERESWPVAVITNGSLLYLPEVREALVAADAVMPTLCTADPDIYQRIHRPHQSCQLNQLLDGLRLFRSIYSGQLWIEVMLLRGINDSEEALRNLAAVLRDIAPDQVHLMLPTRPPAETWVEATDEEGLLRARLILGEIAQIFHPRDGLLALDISDDLADSILGLIARHPVSDDELRRGLAHLDPQLVSAALAHLQATDQAQLISRYGTRFWCVTGPQ